MDTDVFCVLCGGPFDLEQHVYNIDPARKDFQWLYDVRLLGIVLALENHRMTSAGEMLENESGSDDIFLSETLRWTMTDADCFRLGDSFYQVLNHDPTGDILFPLHMACIDIARRVLETQPHAAEAKKEKSTLGQLYHALRSRYHCNKSIGSHTGHDIFSLQASDIQHGPRSVLAIDELGWWSGAYEKFLVDPLSTQDLTPFVFSLLQPMPRESSRTSLAAPPRQPLHALEKLPNELLDRITESMPSQSVLALHRTSRSLAVKVALDDRFWRRQLCNGGLLPSLWDLKENEFKRLIQDAPTDVSWDWRSLLRQLSSTDTPAHEADAKVDDLCKGLWNRYRIWNIIERALKKPHADVSDIRPTAKLPSHDRTPVNTVERAFTRGFFAILAATIAWDLRSSATDVLPLIQKLLPA